MTIYQKICIIRFMNGFFFDIHIGYQLFWIGWWVLLLVYSFLLVLHFLTHHDSHENCNKKVEGRRRKLRSMHWLICHVLQGNNVFTKNKHVALDKIFWWIQLIQSGIQVIRNSVSFIRHNWSNSLIKLNWLLLTHLLSFSSYAALIISTDQFLGMPR